jgi:hypothetical protein
VVNQTKQKMKPSLHHYGLLLAVVLFNAGFIVAQDTATLVPGKKFVAPLPTVAVLPLRYTGEGSDKWREDMSFNLQDLIVTYMDKLPNGWHLQDASKTNALLYKNGVTQDNIRKYTPKELADMIHVQYIVTGSVIQEAGSIRTVTHKRSASERRKREHNHDRSKNSRHSHVSSATVQNFHTDVSVSIYDADGERIFTKSRRSILSDVDAYKAALRYLLKRTPLYSK